MARIQKKPEADFESVKAELDNLPDSKRELGVRLLNKAEFMDAELDKLQAILLEKGWVEKYQNGENQFGLKKSSEGEVYNTLIKSYNATIKQINDLITSVSSVLKADEFESFCND